MVFLVFDAAFAMCLLKIQSPNTGANVKAILAIIGFFDKGLLARGEYSVDKPLLASAF